jgi:hypothetical protein
MWAPEGVTLGGKENSGWASAEWRRPAVWWAGVAAEALKSLRPAAKTDAAHAKGSDTSARRRCDRNDDSLIAESLEEEGSRRRARGARGAERPWAVGRAHTTVSFGFLGGSDAQARAVAPCLRRR